MPSLRPIVVVAKHLTKLPLILADQVQPIVELGNVISNPQLGRSSEDQITVADLTGVAIQDIQIAKMVALAASEQRGRQHDDAT